MNFKTHYYDEAVIHSDRPREILKKPKVIPMPEDLGGKRLVTIANADNSYFTFVFDPNAKEPLGIVEGDYQNPYGKFTINGVIAKQLFDKHYTPKKGEKAQFNEYGGEVRLHPPFQGYKEYPQDVGAYFFTDFNNPTVEYKSGDTIASPLERVDSEKVE